MSPAIAVNIPLTNKPRVVIIGGGFGGIELIKRLRKQEFQVVLIDKNNYHTFQPLLYQVATAGLEPDSIAYPLRKIFKKQDNFHFRMAEAVRINPDQKVIETSIGEIPYDYLVIATGSDTNYFGMKDLEAFSMSLKSVPDALNLRSLILQNFEEALLFLDPQVRDSLMTFVVVGGGPTGVEMAGALGELKNHILPLDYPELDLSRMQIHIVDPAARLLPAMSEKSSRGAETFLRKFDINISLETKVVGYDGMTLVLSNEKKIFSRTVIWAAGVKGAVIAGLREEAYFKGRYKTDSFNRVEGYDTIFAIGDVALMSVPGQPQGYPMMAPVAIQQGRLLSRNLLRILAKQELKPFRYRNMGVMATIGRNQAVVDLHFLNFQGFWGWIVWLFVHLMALVGFRNRVVTFMNWVVSYVSYDKGIRLIIRPFKRNI